jgi:tetratricopeptide (TPR) repeat protein/predicted Ser/Thr protein kinase
VQGDAPTGRPAASEEEEDADGRRPRAPEIVGRDAIKARALARLFGDDPPQGASPPASLPSETATLGRGDAGDPAAPERIGRFRVDARLGGGGMGVVWLAFDPELGRKVAIKVLRPDLGSSAGSVGHARLLREAQAMAQINHPSVITVHEVGTIGDEVFIAMELVEGTTLGGWLRAQTRSWREILQKFCEAGDGIVAAHAAGVVHRDFKPDNVLVGDDGRVRVVDFGLARAANDTGPSSRPWSGSDSAVSALTRTGAMLGTPAYMSPEQWLGRAADERSDQFSFCVALFEALVGRRPFRASTIGELADAVTAGRLDASSAAGVPRFVDKAIRRGLRRDASGRFASMADLLAALRRDPAARIRRLAAVGAVAAIASGVTFWAASQRTASRCDGMQQQLAGVWDDEVRERVRTGMLASGAPFAERAWTSASALLDAHSAAWVDAMQQACAAEVAGPGGADPRRAGCLETRRTELAALTELLATSDLGVVLAAVDAAARLPRPELCADPRQLAGFREIDDPQARAHVAAARATLGKATAAGAVGRFDEAIAAASGVVTEAEALGDPALEAAAWLVRGQLEVAGGQGPTGETSLRRAMSRAEAADDHATRAQALIQLVFQVGQDPKRFAEARALAADAGAVLRVTGADPSLRAQLDGALGVAAKQAGELELALQHHEAATSASRELYGDDHPATLRAMANLGIALRQAGDAARAEQTLQAASDGMIRVLGDQHPSVATSLSALGTTVAQRGRPREAAALFRRALVIREAAEGAAGRNHPSIALAHFNLARALYDAEAYADAQAEYRIALSMRRAMAADDAGLGFHYAGIGRCAFRLGDRVGAIAAFEQRLAIEEKVGLDRPDTDDARTDLALALLATDLDRSDELLDRAARRFERPDAGEEARRLWQFARMLADSLRIAHDAARARIP